MSETSGSYETGSAEASKITCNLCSFIFDEQSSRSSCGGCFTGGCNMVKCPNCNYEVPIETIPGWLKSLMGFFGAKT